jgi:hypothetical protein
MELAVGGQLTEINTFQKYLSIRKHHAPSEANLLVMRIDPTGKFNASSWKLIKEPANMLDQFPSAHDVRGRVRVSAVLSPDAFKCLPS